MRPVFPLHVFLVTAYIAINLLSPAWAQQKPFSFGVIADMPGGLQGQAKLQEAIAEADEDNLAFIVVQGIKASQESCGDTVYSERHKLLNNAENGLIVALAASDWTNCKSSEGRLASIERLNRIREIFFSERFSLGDSKLPVIHQSITPKFSAYSENMRWRIRNVLFATINLPANNNNYLPEAGRNSEFEDRAIANRDWLRRLFSYAKQKRLDGIVLFSDGNPLAIPSLETLKKLRGQRDGFKEIRQQLTKLTAEFPGKVLIIHSQDQDPSTAEDKIVWRKNLGELAVSTHWTKITVSAKSPTLFAVANDAPER